MSLSSQSLQQDHPLTLGDFVASIGHRYDGNPALVTKPTFRNRITTYRELDQQADRIARYFQRRGVVKGDRVLICAPNSPEWVQVFFGCQKAGAVVVPLDVRTAPAFAGAVARLTEARLAVLASPTARLADVVGLPSISLERLESELLPESDLPEGPRVGPEDLAEIVFTSGTTGDPKGVMLTHRNILSNVASVARVFPILPSFRLLSLLPLSHMLEQTVGLLAPLSGGCRIIYPTSRQPSVLFRAMMENAVTTLVAVPQALELLTNAIEAEIRRGNQEVRFQRMLAFAERLPVGARRVLFRAVHEKLGGKLTRVVCGGAYLDLELAKKWELLGVSVLQGYGATEAAPIISGDSPGRRRAGAVGQQFPGVEVRIEVDGEILARGPNVFQGYWRNPDATSEALRDGWYCTGDLGRLDADGFLYLKGRKKDLIVLANGQNVYPEDVEAELARHPALADGVVVGVERDGGNVQVHAALLLRDPSQAADVVRRANERLADHQQIQAFTIWPDEDFPRTATLKVKKAQVLATLHQMAERGAAVAPAPRGPVPENPLHRLIAKASPIEGAEVRPEQTLGEDLHLDSLGRVELLSAIESELGAYVDEAQLGPSTTVADLDRLVSAAGERGAPLDFRAWPLQPAAAVVRETVVQLGFFSLLHTFWKIEVEGREHLRGIRTPIIVAANHHFQAGKYGMDPMAAWMALPRPLRRRICTAGEEHAVFDPRFGGFVARLANAFPISKGGNVRGSLEYMGRLLDLGWSILIFPEGTLTDGGPLMPLMGGTGLMAVECRSPVVPLWIDVRERSVLQGKNRSWRGALKVTIGEPLFFPAETPYAEATARLEAALKQMSAGSSMVPVALLAPRA